MDRDPQNEEGQRLRHIVAGMLSTIEFTPAEQHPGSMLPMADNVIHHIRQDPFDALTKYAPEKLEQSSEDHDLTEMAWGIIANAYGGDWDSASEEWRGAAQRWRDEYHASLPMVATGVEPEWAEEENAQ